MKEHFTRPISKTLEFSVFSSELNVFGYYSVAFVKIIIDYVRLKKKIEFIGVSLTI